MRFSSFLKDCICKISLPVYLTGGGAGVDGAPEKEFKNYSSVLRKIKTLQAKSLINCKTSHKVCIKFLNTTAEYSILLSSIGYDKWPGDTQHMHIRGGKSDNFWVRIFPKVIFLV